MNKPFTAKLSESDIACMLCMSPLTVAEHLVHGWDALRAAAKDDAKASLNVAYARTRCDQAEHAARSLAKYPRKLAAAQAEIAELRAELRFF